MFNYAFTCFVCKVRNDVIRDDSGVVRAIGLWFACRWCRRFFTVMPDVDYCPDCVRDVVPLLDRIIRPS
jgi:hypothetical protein